MKVIMCMWLHLHALHFVTIYTHAECYLWHIKYMIHNLLMSVGKKTDQSELELLPLLLQEPFE